MKSQGRYLPAALAGLGLALPHIALAQNADRGGLQANLTYTEQFFYDDDDEDNETSLRSNLEFELLSETRSQSLSFVLAGGVEKGLSDGFSLDLEDPRIALAYSIGSRNTELSFNASFRSIEVDDLSVLDFDLATLVDDPGDREDFNTGVALEFGREARFGATLSAGYSETNFVNTASPEVIDSERIDGSVRLRFDLSRTAIGFLTASISDLDRDANGLDVETREIIASLDVEITPSLTGAFDLGYREITRGGSETGTSEGISFGASLSAARPNGTISAILDSAVEETGRRSTFQVNRALTLPRGELSAGIGVSFNSETDSTDPLYNIRYSQALPRGSFNVDFSQSFSTTNTGVETLNTVFNVSANQALNEISSLSAGISFSDSDRLSSSAADTRRVRYEIDYSRELTSRWSLVAGIAHTQRRESGGENSSDNEVFLGLRTALSWRP
ncbi:MAG: hypothetical protein AAGF20_02045 [Pseudomonadota bacterium]